MDTTKRKTISPLEALALCDPKYHYVWWMTLAFGYSDGYWVATAEPPVRDGGRGWNYDDPTGKSTTALFFNIVGDKTEIYTDITVEKTREELLNELQNAIADISNRDMEICRLKYNESALTTKLNTARHDLTLARLDLESAQRSQNPAQNNRIEFLEMKLAGKSAEIRRLREELQNSEVMYAKATRIASEEIHAWVEAQNTLLVAEKKLDDWESYVKYIEAIGDDIANSLGLVCDVNGDQIASELVMRWRNRNISGR